MRFIADEGVDKAVVSKLRSEGYWVGYVAELAPGITDEEVLQQANTLNALLITSDKDFGELVFRLGWIHTGVILLRLAGLDTDEKASVVVQTVQTHGAEMVGAFTVISPSTVRIRSKRAG